MHYSVSKKMQHFICDSIKQCPVLIFLAIEFYFESRQSKCALFLSPHLTIPFCIICLSRICGNCIFELHLFTYMLYVALLAADMQNVKIITCFNHPSFR